MNENEFESGIIDSNIGNETPIHGGRGNLKNARKVFIFGIVGIVTSYLIVGIVFAIISLSMEKPHMRQLEQNYQMYKHQKWMLIVGKSLSYASFGMAIFYWLYIFLIISLQGF